MDALVADDATDTDSVAGFFAVFCGTIFYFIFPLSFASAPEFLLLLLLLFVCYCFCCCDV